jgi:hypothetical protein
MEEGSFLREFIAGNAGGLSGILLVYPLDSKFSFSLFYSNQIYISYCFVLCL